ncbi:MAG TPA: signal peptide peptidase SppA [Membranihabitans sp.]|nr:signal peptide peptidase SppA [Membranihabitans sp.]
MRTFFQSILGSCLGVLLAILVIFLILAGIGSSIYSADRKKPKVKNNTVLHLKLDKITPELTNNAQEIGIEYFMEQKKILSIHDYAQAIEKAAEDKNIKGIYLEPQGIRIGQTKREVLEDAILKFKSSGKFVYAYADYYSGGAYQMATLADQIAIFPQGGVDLRGIAAIVPHFKGLSEKLGVEFETYFAGKFKSATEPFRLEHMSDENKLQTNSYLQSLYSEILMDITRNRSIDSISLQRVINEYSARNAQLAKENGLVDLILYKDEMLQFIKDKIGLKEDEDINFITLDNYYTANPPKKDYTVKDKIAILFAEGEIHDGPAASGTISGEEYPRIIREIRQDKDIKALVVRIDSPGGSALASEKVWRELKLTQEAGIPVVASMGSYAASGGYYIASGTQHIIAEPSTITGSIGVFILFPKVGKLFSDKLGINMDTVQTNQYSAAFTPFFPSSPGERQILQGEVDQIYETFLERVAEARNMSRDQVNEVAQGRVWTGKQAIEKGLVDEMGDLQDALIKAAQLAEIDEYRITNYPRIKDPLYQFLEQLTGEDFSAVTKVLQGDMETFLQKKIEGSMNSWSGPQTRMPINLLWD